MSSPRVAGAEINEWCEGSILSGDGHLPGDWDWDHMDGNDIYLRWAAAQYIGHASGIGSWRYGIHQMAWVGARNAAGFREVNLATVMDFDPACTALRGTERTVSWVHDVNWVHHGGFVPQGHARGVWYSPHGYLVWSGAGTETLEPMLAVVRFDADGIYYPQLIMRETGILPTMASNRPFHFNQHIIWDPFTIIIQRMIACWAPWVCEIFKCPPCDSGHRLLLVYSGDLSWVTSGKDNLEDFSNDPSWMGSTINYVLFRPGDHKIFHSGVLADITTIPGYDDQRDHAIYPEVVWNAGTRQWIVTWEERVPMFDDTCLNPGCRGNYRYARTVDENGNLGPVNFLERCWDSEMLTATGDDDHEPPILPIQKGYCYFINAASDHYSDDGVPLADRNPRHLTLHDSYMYEMGSSNIPRWLQEDAVWYVVNQYPDQKFDGAPHVANISVIDWPNTAGFGYPNASYLMFSSKQVDDNTAVQNEFFLLVDQPEHAFSPPTYPAQVEPQQFYHEVAGTVDYTTSRRIPWATSSSILSFMALWAQWNQTTQKMDMKYGNYFFTPE